jgi:glycine/D-amino acid oxidase-like deaminating enzyme/nitrite reductase/ring-hydroxylating ferredoxin subunit/DMSO/TMAO reductase YedYZ heme-binding membrane subunit
MGKDFIRCLGNGGMPKEPERISPWLESVPDKPRYPRLEGAAEADVVVIGGGISGVMSAWFLGKAGLSVILLEKNRIASGDTAYTTGFLIRLPDTSVSALEKRYGSGFVRRIIEGAGKAQDEVRGIVRDNSLDCGFSDCSSYYCAYQEGDAVLRGEWEAIKKADGRASFISGATAEKLGAGIKEAIMFRGEAQFDPRRFIFGLLGLPAASGIRVFEDSEVTGVDIGEAVTVTTASGKVTTGKVVVASGLPIEAFSELRDLFEPKVTYALTARYAGKAPLTADLFWDTYDPYFYYRRLDGKTIILGGSDRGLSERAPPGDAAPHQKLRKFLSEHMPGKCDITREWSGTLYESPDGLPYASEHPHYKGKVFLGCCCGFGGNGLVMGTLTAMAIADLVAGRMNRYADMLSFSRTGTEIRMPQARKAGSGVRNRFFVKAASVGDVSEGSPYCATAGGRRIALFKTDEGYSAISNTCTHAGGPLCEGTLDGDEIQCPLHGARFDIKTGAVLGPPATKPVESFRTRVAGEDIEVEVEGEAPAAGQPASGAGQSLAQDGAIAKPALQTAAASTPAGKGPALFEGARAHIGYILKASVLALLFWSLQFAYQFLFSVPGDLERSIILASSYSGATLIGIALIIGPLAVIFPKLNFIAHRRTFGVWGFTFILSHITAVVIHYQLTPESILGNLDPYANPMVFGALAASFFLPLYLTSTDWAIYKLGFRRWKTIHRIVYLAFLFATLHFTRIHPELLWNMSKAVLALVTISVYSLELTAYFKTMMKRSTAGSLLYGGGLIAFGIILLYLSFVS